MFGSRAIEWVAPMASRPILNTNTAIGIAISMVPKLPISCSIMAPPASAIFGKAGPIKVPNLAMNGRMPITISGAAMEALFFVKTF